MATSKPLNTTTYQIKLCTNLENHRTVLPTKATIRGKGKSDERSLKGRDKSYTLDRAQNSICTPLAKKIMTTPGWDKTLKEERQIKTKTLLQSGNKTCCTRRHGAKMKVISLPLNKKLTHTKHVSKDTRNTQQVIRRKAKKNMTNREGRGQWRSQKELRLDPVQASTSQRTGEEKVLRTL